jgi:hypothetical protein
MKANKTYHREDFAHGNRSATLLLTQCSVPLPRSLMDGILHALHCDERNLPFVWGHRAPPLLSRLGSLYPPDYFKTVQLWTLTHFEGHTLTDSHPDRR